MAKSEWIKSQLISENGGFGNVYLVRKRPMIAGVKRDFAMKELKSDNEEAIHRLSKEVRLLRRINHPSIIKIIDMSLHEPPYYYVMPKYKHSLTEVIPSLKDDLFRVKEIFNNIFAGVGHLHKQGIHHRDLKPANILYNSDSDIAISDLGLGRDINTKSTRITQSKVAMGTFAYMSPEQFDDAKNVDERTDIYSLGRIIYEIFTDRPLLPFQLDVSNIPNEIGHVINKAANLNYDDRYGSVEELRVGLNLAIDAILEEAEENNVNGLMFRLSQSDSVLSEDFEDLISLMNTNQLSTDQIHDLFMDIDGQSFNVLEEKYPNEVKKLITLFTDALISQGWGFSYTDTISVKCQELFNSSNIIRVRTDLLFATLVVGVNHNRWYVMDKAVAMLENIADNAEAMGVYEKLKNEKYYLNSVSDRVEKKKLNRIIQQLFN